MIEDVAEVYRRHTAPWFVGLVAHGSAVKGGVVAGSSDLDLVLYLDAGAFDGGAIRWDVARALHEDLARVDPAPFAYVQCVAEPADRATPLVPGTWHLVAGRCPARAATADEVRARAVETLAFTRRALDRIPAALLETGGGRLRREVRLTATDVWPAVYARVARDATDPLAVWALPKPDAIALLPEPERGLAAAFHAALGTYHAEGETVAGALAALDAARAFLAVASGA